MPSIAEPLHLAAIVPARYATKGLDVFIPGTPSQHRALEAAQRFVAGEIHSLVLLGPPGVGKSHLAAAIANAVRDQLVAEHAAARATYTATLEALEEFDPARLDVRKPQFRPDLPAWVNVPELLTGLRSDMDLPSYERTWSTRVDRAKRAPLLVLDDLGRERTSDWTGEIVYVLANTRYEAGLPTIATSNLAPDELAGAGYWPAISRLAEDGLLVRIEARDRRLDPPAAPRGNPGGDR